MILLRKNPKEYVIEIALSLPIAFVYELMIPHGNNGKSGSEIQRFRKSTIHKRSIPWNFFR